MQVGDVATLNVKIFIKQINLLKMKKLILNTRLSHVAYLLLVAVIFCGCVDHNPKKESEFKIIVVDSCEYIYSYEGVDEGALFTHKGNCKFCSERSKK